MNRFYVSCILLIAFTESASAKVKPMKQIRTLMSYSYPVDPVKIVSIADMDLSYALATTLVAWDKDKQVAAALAGSWERVSPTLSKFKIRNGLKWSDGTAVTASQVKISFEAAFKAHPADLRSLINIVKSLNAANAETIEFHIHEGADTELLGKLTEPNYGILKIGPGGMPDSSVTTGAFYLSQTTASELTLKKNPHWYLANDNMPDEVIIKRPDPAVDLSQVLLNDSWANLAEVSSLVPKELMDRYRAENFQVWTRPLDKVLLIQLSNRSAKADGPALLRYLNAKLDREQLTKGLSGFSIASQVFPEGYQLHDATPAKKLTVVAVPKVFTKRPVQILISKSRVSPALQANIESALNGAGLQYELRFTTLDKISENKKKGDYDIYIGTMGLADPDPEGVMSYYFEGNTPVVQPGNESFLKSLDAARKIKDSQARIRALRGVMTEATEKGHILPLFHLSTVAIGRSNLDFSSVPKSDESVTLSKIRFKKGN
jgi:MarR-like DNA-binding transcriptional regulator SgrR of sgrS sRNA